MIKNNLLAGACDGWLGFDFRGSNHILLSILQYPKEAHLTRRFYYWLPKIGEPEAIIHRIDAPSHAHLTCKKILYSTWQELDALLKQRIASKTICMEYWPDGAIPTYSIVDAGTFQYLTSLGATITSSWNLLGSTLAGLSTEQQQSHLQAAKHLEAIVKETIQQLKSPSTEYSLQQFILTKFKELNLVTEHPPIVAFGPNAALPHYEPTKERSSTIASENVLLIDLWAKLSKDNAVYADLTKVFYVGKNPSDEILSAYSALYVAQESAINYIKNEFKAGHTVRGSDVDTVCRTSIGKAGFGPYFTHRTGHNITTQLHGPGPNIDGYETNDVRVLLPRSCSSIEPGIYIPGKFGLRTECNILIQQDMQVVVSGKANPQLEMI